MPIYSLCEPNENLSAAEVCLLDFFKQEADDGLRLYQYLRYAIEVFGIGRILTRITDKRKDPTIPMLSVLVSLLMAAVLRVPSINQLEHLLKSRQFQYLLGERSKKYHNQALFSADNIVDVLEGMDIPALQTSMADIIKKAERNKAFRDDTFGTFICVAIDGWEPFCSYRRHCDACLTRQVKRKEKLAAARKKEDVELDDEDIDGDPEEKVTQYYHRFVVAFLVAPKLDLTLAIEPVLTEAQLVAKGAKVGCGDEGELTAALRLINRLHETYGCFIDAFALDGLYPCGPIFQKLTEYNYGACIVTRDIRKDPYRFAASIWKTQEKPDQIIEDTETRENLQFYRMKDVDALSSFNGSVDMLKAIVTTAPRPKKIGPPHKNTRGRNINIPRPDRGPKVSTWTMALVGKAKRLNNVVALRIMRSRWHIENTAFHQWVTQWDFDHCYRHTPNAITAVMHIFALAFNLMQLFFYRRLNKPRRGRPVNDTLVACVKTMWLDLGQLAEPVPWDLLIGDTS